MPNCLSRRSISRSWSTVSKAAVKSSRHRAVTCPLSAAGIYFQYAIVAIGVLGAAANALVLYAMIASKVYKKQLLIFNQNAFDFCSSLLLVVVVSWSLTSLFGTNMAISFSAPGCDFRGEALQRPSHRNAGLLSVCDVAHSRPSLVFDRWIQHQPHERYD